MHTTIDCRTGGDTIRFSLVPNVMKSLAIRLQSENSAFDTALPS